MVAGIALLAAWISLDPGFDAVRNLLGNAQLPGRIVGSVDLILLVAAAIVMAAGCRDKVRGGWQFAAFALGALCISAVDWAKLAPAVDLRSLHATIGVVI